MIIDSNEYCYPIEFRSKYFQYNGDPNQIPYWVYERMREFSSGDGSKVGDHFFTIEIGMNSFVIKEFRTVTGGHRRRQTDFEIKCNTGDYLLEKHPSHGFLGVETQKDFESQFIILKE